MVCSRAGRCRPGALLLPRPGVPEHWDEDLACGPSQDWPALRAACVIHQEHTTTQDTGWDGMRKLRTFEEAQPLLAPPTPPSLPPSTKVVRSLIAAPTRQRSCTVLMAPPRGPRPGRTYTKYLLAGWNCHGGKFDLQDVKTHGVSAAPVHPQGSARMIQRVGVGPCCPGAPSVWESDASYD